MNIQQLADLYEHLSDNPAYPIPDELSAQVRDIFSTNVRFLRAYLGIWDRGNSYEQREFAQLVGITPNGLRRWEYGEVIPNQLYLRSLAELVNNILDLPMPVTVAHILCRPLIHEIHLLRIGTLSPAFRDLNPILQAGFREFIETRMDEVLRYFLSSARDADIEKDILVERTLVGFIAIDPTTGRLSTVNSYVETLTGYTADELLKLPSFSSLLTEASKEQEAYDLAQIQSPTIKTVRSQLTINCRPGKQRIIDRLYAQLPNGMVIGNILDVTHVVAQTRALRQSEEKYRLLVENTSDFIVTLDANGNVLFASPSYIKTFGRSIGQLAQHGYMDLIHAEDRETSRQALQNAQQSPFSSHSVVRQYRADGSLIYVKWNQSGVRVNGHIDQIICHGVDITEEILVHQQTTKDKQFYEVLFHKNPQMMVLYNMDTHRIIRMNLAAQERYGYSEEDLATLTPHQLFAETERKRLTRIHEKDPGKPVYGGMWKQITKSGDVFMAELRLSPPLGLENGRGGLRLLMIDDVDGLSRTVTGIFHQTTMQRTILNNAPMPIMLGRVKDGPDIQRPITSINPAAADLLGTDDIHTLTELCERLHMPDIDIMPDTTTTLQSIPCRAPSGKKLHATIHSDMSGIFVVYLHCLIN